MSAKKNVPLAGNQGQGQGDATGVLDCANIVPDSQLDVKSDCDVVLSHLGDWLRQVRRGESSWADLMTWAHRPEIEALVQKYTDVGGVA